MKRELLASSLVVALIAAPAGFARAADQAQPTGIPGPTTVPERMVPRATPELAPKEGEVIPGVISGSEQGTPIAGKDLSNEYLQDKTVYDLQNEKVGTVKDVAESVGEGRQAIVEVGGILGFGGKDVAVPVRHFQLQSDGRLVVKLTEDELKEMPEVRKQDSSASRQKS